MSLIFKKSGIVSKFIGINKLIFGLPKTGKSTLCSHMKEGNKEPLFISTEPGLNALNVHTANVRSWEKFTALIDYIKKNVDEVRKVHSCIIVDLISDIDDFASTHVCEANKVKSLADMPWGAGFAQHKNLFKSAINELFDILPLVFITHTKEKEINYMGVTKQTQVPTMSNRNFDFINGKVDAIGYIVPAADEDGESPMLTFRPTTSAIAGSRFKQLTKSDYVLDIDNMERSYKEIEKSFNIIVKDKKGAKNGNKG